MHRPSFLNIVLLGQGIFYLITGIWPLVSINTFQKVTGPKQDLWLVRTVGVLITAISIALLVGGQRRKVNAEAPILAIGSAYDIAWNLSGVVILAVGIYLWARSQDP